jgi:hypothetical protein
MSEETIPAASMPTSEIICPDIDVRFLGSGEPFDHPDGLKWTAANLNSFASGEEFEDGNHTAYQVIVGTKAMKSPTELAEELANHFLSGEKSDMLVFIRVDPEDNAWYQYSLRARAFDIFHPFNYPYKGTSEVPSPSSVSLLKLEVWHKFLRYIIFD